jgi:hypothetical protein
MNARKILTTVLVLSLVATGFIYLLLPVYAQDGIPAGRSVAVPRFDDDRSAVQPSRPSPMVPTSSSQAPEFPSAPLPSISQPKPPPNGASPAASIQGTLRVECLGYRNS